VRTIVDRLNIHNEGMLPRHTFRSYAASEPSSASLDLKLVSSMLLDYLQEAVYTLIPTFPQPQTWKTHSLELEENLKWPNIRNVLALVTMRTITHFEGLQSPKNGFSADPGRHTGFLSVLQ
jgi:hypothetical protein